MVFAGIDVGSRTVKAALLRSDENVPFAFALTNQGVDQETLAMDLLDRLLREHELARDDVSRIIATGYGRNALSAASRAITEITCQARGVLAFHPEVRTVIEIGGQDSKLIRIDENGVVYDFAMNDRCAAGTGQFMELVARKLGIELQELGRLAAAAENPAPISSMCAVFAETEIIGLLAARTAPADIVAGVCRSIASRLTALTGGKVKPPVYFTGGVALIDGMDKALAEVLGCEVRVAKNPQATGAVGAAVLARQ